MELSIDQLRTFVTVVRANSYTKAACILNMTQSAVSMQMKRLEETTGLLFVKHGKSFSVSPLGEKLMEHAQRILRAHDEALSVLSDPDVHDYIRLGAPELYASSVFPSVLRKFYAKYPNSRIDFNTLSRENILSMVQNSQIDIALCANMPDEYERHFSEKVVWIASADSRVQDMRPLPLAVYPDGCHMRRAAAERLTQAGIEYRISFAAASVFAIMAAVRAGIAVSPMGVTKFMGDKDSFRILDDLPPMPDNNLSIVRSPDFHSKSADYLVGLIKEELNTQMKLL